MTFNPVHATKNDALKKLLDSMGIHCPVVNLTLRFSAKSIATALIEVYVDEKSMLPLLELVKQCQPEPVVHDYKDHRKLDDLETLTGKPRVECARALQEYAGDFWEARKAIEMPF